MEYINESLIDDIDINKIIIPPITKFGRDKLKDMIHYFIYQPEILIRRQEILYEMIKNKKIKNQIIDILEDIKYNEEIIDTWFEDKIIIKDFYFKNEYLNNKYILNVYHKTKSIFTLILLVIYILILILYKIINPESGIIDIYHSHINLTEYLMNPITENKIIIQMITILFMICLIIYIIFTIELFYTNYKSKKIETTDYDRMREILIDIEKIYDMDIFMKNEKKVLGNDLDKLDDIFIKNKDLMNIIGIHNKKNEYHNEFNRIINYIASLDALISISNMIGYGYTLPIFIFNGKTKLKIENVYNPIMNTNNQIKNNFELKDTNLNIITGANLTGKSTYIQSISLNVLLAQTFGICPCTKIIIKPFTKIILSVNIKDKLFMNQLNKCSEIIKESNEIDNNLFIAIDDLFYGCNPYETFALTNAYTNYLANCDNLIGIITTQYSYISKNKLVQYNKFDTEYNKITNSFKYDYKLKEGISQQNIVLQLLMEKGWNDMIINETSKLL
jgi:hypothetical protein